MVARVRELDFRLAYVGAGEYPLRLNQPFMNRSFTTYNEIKDLRPYF